MKLDKIELKIVNKIENLGYMLEYVEFVKEGDNNILRVVIDKENENVSIDDCEKVSRAIEDDVDKEVKQEYVLEVSSAGLERQLKNIKLFKKYIGYKIFVKLYKKQEYGKEVIGILEKVNNENESITINIDGKLYNISIKDIAMSHTVYDFDNLEKDDVNINKLKKF